MYRKSRLGKFKNTAEQKDWVSLSDDDIDKYRENIISSLTEMCKESIPIKNHRNNNNKHKSFPWWDSELKEIKEKRNNKYRELRNEPRTIEKNKLKEEYCILRNKFIALLRSKKQKYKEQQIEKITPNNNDSQLWGFVRAYEGDQINANKKLPPILNQNNTLITNDQEKANIIGEHYKNISSRENYNEPFKQIMDQQKSLNEDVMKKSRNNKNLHN